MTSAEVSAVEPPLTKKVGVDDCLRKPSFKCGGPGRTGVRCNRRSASVQALTTKFNLLSQSRPNRVVVGKPKKFAKPAGYVAVKPILPKRTLLENCEVPKKVEDLRKTVELCLPNKETPLANKQVSKNKPILKNDGQPLEPIYEAPCLPVRTAIGLFEAGAVGKPLNSTRPIAAVKPIVKPVEEKPKPKLAPRDSLSRVRYKVLRRTRGRDDVDEEKCEADKSELVDRDGVKLVLEKIQEVTPESKDPTTIELRRQLSCKEFEAIRERLEQENINVVNNLKNTVDKEDNIRKNREKLNEIFAQISQSNLAQKRTSEKSYEHIISRTVKNPSPQLAQISESQVGKITSIEKERKFAALLRNNVPHVCQKKEDTSDETIHKEVEKLFDDAVKSTDNCLKHPDSKVDNLKPNSSFLWSKPCAEGCRLASPKEPEDVQQSPGMGNTPLPKPPESFIPDCSYERVGRASAETEYDEMSLNELDENPYDTLNNQVPIHESLYCVSERLDSINVYEDIQSLRAVIAEDGKGVKEECYEEVEEGCYESIYGGVNGLDLGRSDSSTKSSFEKINSLYESAGGLDNRSNADIASDTDASPVQLISQNLEMDNISTNDSSLSHDTTNSDDWVEISDSEPEMSKNITNRRSKRQKGIYKVRANWSELQKRTNEKTAYEDPAALSNDEHFYESIPQSQECNDSPGTIIEESSGDQTANHTQAPDDIADDSSCIDDFSSDEDCPESQLPAEPVQHKLTQSLRAAGKKLRQNLTLRKSDLSKSLKRFRPRVKSESCEEGGSKFYCELSVAPKGVRPSGPPPPPPSVETNGTQYADVRVSGNELYAECGLFKHRPKTSGGRSSWYTEAGLYGTSSGSNLEAGKAKPLFVDEPLYQFYTECVNAQARDDILQHYDSDGYEAINDYYSFINEKRRTLDVKVPMPNLEDFNDVPVAAPSFQTLNRTLWCQIPEVVNSCILSSLSEKQRKLQEAKFEILTSEGSYIHSLNVLESHFMAKLTEFISSRDQRMLFSNILMVKAVSQRLLAALETCWNESIMLNSICEVIYKHAQDDFQVYVKFCKHSTTVHRTLKTLIETNPGFALALRDCERSSVCHSLSLSSFLLLPMQRITRLPLLLGQVLTRLEKDDPEYHACENAFTLLNKIVKECDEEATRMEKTEEMLLLSQQLFFPKVVRSIPIISGSRCLIKRGSATLLLGKDESKLTFGRRASKVNVHLLLFTDILVVARMAKGRGLRVVDYCPRNLVQVQPSTPVNYMPLSLQKNLVLLTLLENHEKKTVEMLLSLPMESDISRWQDSVSPVLSDNPLEIVYESWDCPQVIAIYEYTATHSDELSLCIGDVVNVLKKIPDGWYQGERLRDGVIGWFPSNHTQEISSAHVRAKNKKQRYRLLALSSTFIEQNKLSVQS